MKYEGRRGPEVVLYVRVEDSELYLFSFIFIFLNVGLEVSITLQTVTQYDNVLHICHMSQLQSHSHISHRRFQNNNII